MPGALLVDLLEVNGQIICIDGLVDGALIARLIHDQGGYYVIRLFPNQGTVFTNLATYVAQKKLPVITEIVRKDNRGEEIRRKYRFCNARYVQRKNHWSGVREVVLIEEEKLDIEGNSVKEEYYYLSSAFQDQAKLVALLEKSNRGGGWSVMVQSFQRVRSRSRGLSVPAIAKLQRAIAYIRERQCYVEFCQKRYVKAYVCLPLPPYPTA